MGGWFWNGGGSIPLYRLWKSFKVMFTETYLEPIRKSTMELCFTLIKPYFKNILILIKLPLASIFYTTYPFKKKLTIVKTLGKKVFINSGTIFFWNLKIYNEMASSQNMNREGFLNKHLLIWWYGKC